MTETRAAGKESMLSTLPLLRKELVEQGLRFRTFTLRGLFALLLFLVFSAYFIPFISRYQPSPMSILGMGADVFQQIVWLLTGAIFLFLPAMAAAAFPAERERGGLELLWITRMSPLEILLQKYLSCTLQTLTLLLISLPLFALTLAFGGVTPAQVWLAFTVLVLTCLQAGAMGIWFSCACKTTARALIFTYLFAAGFYLLPPLILTSDLDNGFLLFPPSIYFHAVAGGPSLGSAWLQILPAALSVMVFLFLARRALVKRSPSPFKALSYREAGDLKRTWIHRRRGRGPRISGLPDKAPISWREKGRQILGMPETIIRNVLLVCLGLLLGAFLFHHFCIVLLWIVAIVIVTLRGSSTVQSERRNQTLDVLLTTPMTGRAILLQKFSGIRRIIALLALPFLVLNLHETLFPQLYYGRYFSPGVFPSICILLISMLMVIIFLALFGYLSMWIGLRSKTGTRAAVVSLLVVFLWIFVPVLVWRSMGLLFHMDENLLVLSPAYVIMALPRLILLEKEWKYLAPLAVSLLAYGHLIFIFRYLCLRRADRLLGRVKEPTR